MKNRGWKFRLLCLLLCACALAPAASAFSEGAERLPDRDTLIRALDQLPQDLLYSDKASVLYRALTALGIPSRILSDVNR